VSEPIQSPAEMRLTVSRPREGCVVLHVVGEVDLLGTPALDAEIAKQVTDVTPATLVLDLESVPFFGSSGIAALVRAAQLAKDHGVRLLLVASGRAVLRPLEVTATASLFTIHESLHSALAQV
jgi:anti-sigma B factor antagonist